MELFRSHSWADATVPERERGGEQYALSCASCHQADGKGMPGMFPPLAKVDWVNTREPDLLIRVVLHGLIGPVSINGEPFFTTAPIMPAQGELTDRQIADILTYIRSAWGNEAPSVQVETVAKIRKAEVARKASWTQKELLEIQLPES